MRLAEPVATAMELAAEAGVVIITSPELKEAVEAAASDVDSVATFSMETDEGWSASLVVDVQRPQEYEGEGHPGSINLE